MNTNEVSQYAEPCVLHKTHSPITVINERHHPFPQAWQIDLWGDVRDSRTVAVCATGHNSIHEAIRYHEQWNKFPDWCRGATRLLAQEAFDLRDEHTRA
jgi:aminopeptidase C